MGDARAALRVLLRHETKHSVRSSYVGGMQISVVQNARCTVNGDGIIVNFVSKTKKSMFTKFMFSLDTLKSK